MKLLEKWKLSGVVYNEVAFRSIQMSRGQSQTGSASSEQDLKKRFNQSMGSAKTSKLAFAILGTIGSAFPFLEYATAPTPEALISGVSLSLAISLAYIVFYSLQILPSFSSGEPYAILRTLPVNEEEFSRISTLSLIRTFDYIALSTTIVQVGSIWLLTHSAIASVLMLVGSAINIVFAMGLAIWFSRIFYTHVARGGRSTRATIGRSIFLITWGVAALSIGFIFNFISYLLPYLTSAILGIFARPAGLVLLVIHPFSIGFTIADLVYPSLFSSIPLPSRTVLLVPRYVPPTLAIVATFAYVLLAIFVAFRTISSVSKITKGSGAIFSRTVARDYDLSTSSPLRAYIVKDLRLAAMNPSLAFLYAAPLFEVLTLAVITVQFPEMKATAMIVSTMVGCFFTTMISSTLLNSEGAGLEYTTSLPLRSKTIIDAKALIAALTFVPVPLALLVIGLLKHVTSNYILLIPFAEFIAVYAACIGEVGFFLRTNRQSSLRQTRGFSMMASSDIRRLIESLTLAFMLILIPAGIYAVSYLESSSHLFAVLTMLVSATLEFGIAFAITRRGSWKKGTEEQPIVVSSQLGRERARR